jgi:hypothetical protein
MSERILIELSPEQIEAGAQWWVDHLAKASCGWSDQEYRERYEALPMPSVEQLWFLKRMLVKNFTLGLPGGMTPRVSASHNPEVVGVDYEPDHLLQHAMEHSLLPAYVALPQKTVMRFQNGGIWVRHGYGAPIDWILPAREGAAGGTP